MELVIVLAIVLIIFGPRKLPQLGRSLGRGMREFRSSVRDIGEQIGTEPALHEESVEGKEEAVTGEIVGEDRASPS
jgi:TatA/E family protein of Tat protein translocase